MPGAFQLDLPPPMWGVTMQQLLELRQNMRTFYERLGQAPADKTMRDVVDDIVEPATRGGGVGYALHLNRDRPVQAAYMVSHSWGEGFLEFVDALAMVSDTLGADGLWICALALYQKRDGDGGPGPTIAEQLGEDVLDGPFVAVVRGVKRMLVVQTRQSHVYTRLWCVLELYQAIHMAVDVRLLGTWTWESSKRIEPQHATCHSATDAAKISAAVEGTIGWDTIKHAIVRQVKCILATRLEWPILRPWEWMLLEAIRRDDTAMAEDAVNDPAVDLAVRVGGTYGDPRDGAHVYHLVMSFGGLRWEVGDTLYGTARLNGAENVAAVIARHGGEDVGGGDPRPDAAPRAAPVHASRDEGPFVRAWEWKLLEAIRRGDVPLVHEAAALAGVNWAARIAETYGDAGDGDHVYYLVMSFGLEWNVGDTLLETARRNGRSDVAAAIESYMEGRAEALASPGAPGAAPCPARREEAGGGAGAAASPAVDRGACSGHGKRGSQACALL